MNENRTRALDKLRPLEFELNYLRHPKGSVLVSMGGTRVICAVSVEAGAPRWKREQGIPGGWVTGEYAMMPGSTSPRKRRPRAGGKPDSRSLEIQRLIGRSLRAVVDLQQLGDCTVSVDCDVLDADGGTRCASISGAAVALELAFRKMFAAGQLNRLPLRELVAAVSVGIVNGQPVLDLDYRLDSTAEVDMNVVMTESGRFVEIQGTGEEYTFDREQLDAMLALATRGIKDIIRAQKQVLGPATA